MMKISPRSRALNKRLDQLYAVNYAGGAKVTADAVRGPEFLPGNVLKKGRQTYWSTPEGTTSATLIARPARDAEI